MFCVATDTRACHILDRMAKKLQEKRVNVLMTEKMFGDLEHAQEWLGLRSIPETIRTILSTGLEASKVRANMEKQRNVISTMQETMGQMVDVTLQEMAEAKVEKAGGGISNTTTEGQKRPLNNN